ncbi:MAG: hypothetical protein AB1744_14490 [Candidatus Zixiibacteriota bacterium]
MKARAKTGAFLKWSFLGILIASLVGLPLALFLGCSNNPLNPTTPEYDIDHGLAAVEFADSLLSAASSGPQLSSSLDYLKDDPYFCCDAAVSEEVDDGGGSLKIQLDNEEIFFIVPEGALDQNVEISIHGYKFSTPDGNVFLYECLPSGLVFQEPMWIEHPVSNLADGEYAGLFYSGDDGTLWSFEQVSPATNGWALFEIHHFSMYGISSLSL